MLTIVQTNPRKSKSGIQCHNPETRKPFTTWPSCSTYGNGRVVRLSHRNPSMFILTRGHSFIGKTGGEIFHEMMLRQGVKHICELSLTSNQLTLLTHLFQSATLAAPFYPYSMLSTTRNISTSFSQNMSKVLGIWQRAMRGLVVYLVSFS
jgi:hypothetical protein